MNSNNNLYSNQNVFLIGPMGVGKTTIGKMLAKELGLQFIDTDEEVERRAGANILPIVVLPTPMGPIRKTF